MDVTLKKQVYKIELELTKEELGEIIDAMLYNNGDSNTAIMTETTEMFANYLASIYRDANQVEEWQREGK